jgi:oligopeptide transport system substrate-binding protein
VVSRSAAAVLPLVCCLLAVPAPARAESGTGVTVSTCPPYGPLTLGEAGVCGGDMLDALFTGLVEYDPRTSRATYAMARSISTKDNRRFTVRLREGWTFHDGTEVKAHNFVDAWNQTAAAGKSGAAFLFEDIKGYGSRVMSGLRVVDDRTFTIELKRPLGPFTQKLGHVAFSPLPDSVLKNPASFRREPVGNGPFRAVAWAPGAETVLERYDGYAGPSKAQIDKITYRVYPDDYTAYAELLNGGLDFLAYVPPVKLDRFAKDLDGRVISRPGGVIQEIGIPLRLGTNADLRKAVSMAIDRKAITRKFYGGRSPAESFVPSPAEGAKPGACGTFCRYDPARARVYLARAKAKGFRTPAGIPLYYNADSAHGDWVRAVAASVDKVFGGEVKIVPRTVKTNDAFQRAIDKGTLQGMFRMGWQLDYPHIQNVLGPQFASGATFNYGLYRNPRFDALLRAADREVSRAKAIGLYRRAEAMLVRDMPAIPLWFYRDTSGYSRRIAAPALTPFGWLDPVSVRPA